ncbi:MAG: TIR domain-containing protein [bacterium]|nr:TIR domain-containing protein [bacterium]
MDPRERARKILRKVYRRWRSIWEHRPDPLDMLDPEIALRHLHGYTVEWVPEIPVERRGVKDKVAGLLDRRARKILISSFFGPLVGRFTLAHELGHLEMHSEHVLYRDPPRACPTGERNPPGQVATDDLWSSEEREADQFAAEYLMPRRQLEPRFRRQFGMDRFDTNLTFEELANRLHLSIDGRVRASDLEKMDRRTISRLVARSLPFSAETGDRSLAQLFRVSHEAMAIQLEDHDLVTIGSRKPRQRFDVFVSYNSNDLESVSNIADGLERREVLPWLAGRELDPGEVWQKTVASMIKSIDCAVFCLGPHGVEGWQEMELHALNEQRAQRNLRVIPVILPGTVGEPELPLFLKSVQIVDFRRTEPDPLELLIKSISARRREPLPAVTVS